MEALGFRDVNVVTLFVEDLPGTLAFYQEVFGRMHVWADRNSAVYDFGNMSINLLSISEAPGLIQPATAASREAGSRFMFTIWVEDVDAVAAVLAKRGVELLNGPADRSWGVRSVSFADPGGHIWEMAQQLF